MMKKFNTRTMTTVAMLVAIEIVLNRFLSINAWNLKIGFAFLPVVVAAVILGPVYAGAVAAIGDIIGAWLFPVGPFFPGFTLTALLTGVVYGIFLYKKQDVKRILAAVAVNQLILVFLVNSLWISIVYGAPYTTLLATRIVQCAILIPLQIIVTGAIVKPMVHLKSRIAV